MQNQECEIQEQKSPRSQAEEFGLRLVWLGCFILMMFFAYKFVVFIFYPDYFGVGYFLLLMAMAQVTSNLQEMIDN